MDYNSLKKLEEESLKQLQEGSGPADSCICNLFTSQDEGRGIAASLKRAFGSIGKTSKRGGSVEGRSVNIPLTFQKGGHGIYTTKRTVQRQGKCGKCACDSEKVVLKDSDLSIRITTPDISTICPCPSDCLPDKAKLQDNIKVTIEYAKTPDVLTPWSNTKSTKEQVTPAQTRSIKERSDEKEPLEEMDSLSTMDLKDATERLEREEDSPENDGQEKSA